MTIEVYDHLHQNKAKITKLFILFSNHMKESKLVSYKKQKTNAHNHIVIQENTM